MPRVFGRVLSGVVAVCVAGALLAAPASGQVSSRAVSGVAVSGGGAGVVVVSWTPPTEAPVDYRVMWARSDLDYLSYRLADEAERGNAYPAGGVSSLRLEGLTPGADYKVVVRARYGSGGTSSGPWSDHVSGAAGAAIEDDDSTDGDSDDGGGQDDGDDSTDGDDQDDGDDSTDGDDQDDGGGAVVVGRGFDFVGAMTVGTSEAGGKEVLGYSLRAGGVGSFSVVSVGDDADAWAVGGRGFVHGLMRVEGRIALPSGLGEFDDPVVLMTRGRPGVVGPFVLEAGGRVYSSASALVSNVLGPADMFWVWEDPCADWAEGEQVAVSFDDGAASDAVLGSTDASLSQLSLAGGTLGGQFASGTLDYSAAAGVGETEVTVGALPADPNACSVTVSPADADTDTDGHQVGVDPDDGAVITVTVTAGDNATARAYTVTVAPGGGALPAAPAKMGLDGIDIGFDPARHRYDKTVPPGATTTTLTVRAAPGTDVDTAVYRPPASALLGLRGRFALMTAQQMPVSDGQIPLPADRDTLVVTTVSTPGNERQAVYTTRLRPQPQQSAIATTAAPAPEPRLSGLTVSPGTLEPAFAADTFEYVVAVAHDVSQVTIAPAAPEGTTAQVGTPDADTDTDGHQIALNAPTRNSTAQTAVVVTAARGNKIDSYTVTFVRNVEPEPRLSGLTVSPGTLEPTFAADTFEYVVAVAHDVSQVTIAPAAPEGTTAQVETPDADTDTDGHQIALNAPTRNSTAQTAVVVTATRGGETASYTFTFVRNVVHTVSAPADIGPITMELPEHCKLELLGNGNWMPRRQLYPHGSSRLCRQIDSPHRAARHYLLHLLEPTEIEMKVYGNGSISVIDVYSADGEHVATNRSPLVNTQWWQRLTTSLDRGAYVVQVAGVYPAWNPDGFSKHYHHTLGVWGGANVVRPADFQLADLDVSGGGAGLVSFDPDVTVYRSGVAAGVSAVTVVAVPRRADAVVTISPADADPSTDGHQVALDTDGGALIDVRVSPGVAAPMAAAGLLPAGAGHLGEYTVRLVAAPGTADPTLSALSLSGFDYGTFSSDRLRYARVYGHDESFDPVVATLSATATHSGATWAATPADADTNTDGHQVRVEVGTVVEVTVTSADGLLSNTYTVAVSREAPPSDDATLEALAVPGGIWPAFSPDTTAYLANTPTATGTYTVAAFPSDPSAAVAISPDDADTDTDGHQLSLTAGAATATVTVTSADGTATRVYAVAVTRPADPDTDSSLRVLNLDAAAVDPPDIPGGLANPGLNAVLSAVTLRPAFAAATTAYAVSADRGVAHITVDALAAVSDATVAITPPDADPDTDGHQLDLAAARAASPGTPVRVTVTVTSAGSTTETAYTITVTHPPPPIEPITMELPDNCVLERLGDSYWSPYREWNQYWTDEFCPATNTTHADNSRRAAGYYLLVVTQTGEVTLQADTYRKPVVTLYAADGEILAKDWPNVDGYDRHITTSLDRGAYVVEVASYYPSWHNRDRHRLSARGDHIVRSADFELTDLDISGVDLTGFDPETALYVRQVAADQTTVTVTAVPRTAHPQVTITPTDADPNTDGHQVTLDADGETDITVTVAPDGTAAYPGTYRVKLIQ